MRRPAPGAKAPAARARRARRRRPRAQARATRARRERRRRPRAHAGQRRSLLRRGSTRCPCCPSACWMRRQSPCVRATAAARTPSARAPARRTLLPHTPHVSPIRAWHTRLSVCHVGFRVKPGAFRVKPGARTRRPRASADQVHKPGIGSANSTLRTVSDVTHGKPRVSRPFTCETRSPDAPPKLATPPTQPATAQASSRGAANCASYSRAYAPWATSSCS
jgi:hypothetical protein